MGLSVSSYTPTQTDHALHALQQLRVGRSNLLSCIPHERPAQCSPIALLHLVTPSPPPPPPPACQELEADRRYLSSSYTREPALDACGPPSQPTAARAAPSDPDRLRGAAAASQPLPIPMQAERQQHHSRSLDSRRAELAADASREVAELQQQITPGQRMLEMLGAPNAAAMLAGAAKMTP